jgi:hypothetical protein
MKESTFNKGTIKILKQSFNPEAKSEMSGAEVIDTFRKYTD